MTLAEGVKSMMGYFQTHAEHMNYDEYEKNKQATMRVRDGGVDDKTGVRPLDSTNP